MRLRHRSSFAALAAVLLAALLAGGCMALDDFQRRAIFRPSKDARATPTEFHATYQDIWLQVGAGNGTPRALHAWWIPAAGDVARSPAALYLHGAGFGISANLPRIMKLRDEGYSVLAIDYRGFGLSDGDLPSEDSAYEDAQAAWVELQRLAPQSRRFIYGHSLGGAIAVHLAQTPVAADAAGLVVESSFTSVREMHQYTMYNWIPLGAIQTQFFDALAKAPKLCVPSLFMHGTADYRVPVEVARRLYDAAPAPKRWLLVEGARHVDIPTRYTAQWSAALRELRDLAGAPHAACKA